MKSGRTYISAKLQEKEDVTKAEEFATAAKKGGG